MKKVNKTCQKLASFPEIGRKRDELRSGLRSFPINDYLIFYRSTENTIEVLRIVSGYRNLGALFETD
ncbi:type II toxin-antitoxin system RelE/ParE family toxin [Trichothermofontia sp.]